MNANYAHIKMVFKQTKLKQIYVDRGMIPVEIL